MFCENETNNHRLWGSAATGEYFKDGINDYIVNGDQNAVNPAQLGTKAAAHYQLNLPAGGSAHIRLRLSGDTIDAGFVDFDSLFERRRAEADEFYAVLQHGLDDPEMRGRPPPSDRRHAVEKAILLLRYPGMARRRPAQPPPPAQRKHGRNADWRHLNNADIISVPDKWEYPWYAAWDLAFHAVILAGD